MVLSFRCFGAAYPAVDVLACRHQEQLVAFRELFVGEEDEIDDRHRFRQLGVHVVEGVSDSDHRELESQC